ncbi:MAG: 23S rRNA (uracil(1939)-C(5))-methyltransferase RlmD, partial [Vallitaleaceae bacterium]|nr:23S rRNA (uracil(1939)-C(5))-methyltransferase RlmD [Vallitaleaceae bacterium]
MSEKCPVIKNESYQLRIDSLGSMGEGIGRMDGYAIFVDGAIPGDLCEIKVLKVKKNYAYAKLTGLLEASKDRIEPICKVARQCGGCNLQHMNYEAQLHYKENIIRNSLERIGGFPKEDIDRVMEAIIGAAEPYYYRNKVQYPVREEDGKLQIGFYAKHSHRIVESDTCYIQDPRNMEIVKSIRNFMIEFGIKGYNEEAHSGLLRHIVIRKSTFTDRFHVILVINGDKFPKVDKLKEILEKSGYVQNLSVNINKKRTNVIFDEELDHIAGEEKLVDNIKDLQFLISPQSFFQVNHEQTEKLYEKALEFAGLSGEETVFDLYCGIGTISLFLARMAKEVHGVEIVEEAILDANQNAEKNGISNAHFYVGKAEEVVPTLYHEKEIRADVVVVDPPRKGCEESLLSTIVEMEAKKIVYVSCDPSTLARDLKYLASKGYELQRVVGVDMFPMTV